jgi:hypothetical protein
MPNWTKTLLFLTFVLVLAATAGASDVYFAPNAQGSNNGSNCANAYAYNDGTHGWNASSSQVAGNNLHACPGTYNASAGGTMLTTVNSGSSGQPITLIADQGAATFQSPYFSAGGGIAVNNTYWVINGDNNLTIQNTLNGSPGASCIGGPCSYQESSYAIVANAGNLIVENTTFSDIYLHVRNDTNGTGSAVYFLNDNNVTISGNTIHDARLALAGWGSNVVVSNNTMYNCAAAYWFGANVSTSNVLIHDNYMYNVGNWATTNDTFHLEYIHMFTNYGSYTPIGGLQIYNNYFGSPGANCCQSAMLYFEGSYENPMIFNNVFQNANNGVDYMPAINMEVVSSPYKVTNPVFVNNTFIGYSISTSAMTTSGLSGITWQNNVVTGNGTLYSSGDSGADSFASGGVNNNAYENIASDYGAGQPFGYNAKIEASLPPWQSALPSSSGADSASKFVPLTTLGVNSDGTLQAGSVAIGLGANLSGLNITPLSTGAPATFGAGGSCGAGCLPRPSNGAWDAGAYPYGANSQSPPSAPTGLVAVVN